MFATLKSIEYFFPEHCLTNDDLARLFPDWSVEKIESKTAIKSPLVGTVYLSPEPGAKPFVSVGKKIKKGDTVMIVEAMKTMNHIPSPINGTIKKICIEDGQPVEYGQVLVLLD